jgi:hypothetical protein
MQIDFMSKVYHGFTAVQCNLIFDNDSVPIFDFHNGDEPPLWETLATQNMEQYGILDPHDDPPSLDYSHFLPIKTESHPVSDKMFSWTNLEAEVVQP